MQIKTTRMAVMKKKSVSKNLEKKELFCTVGVNVNWFSHYRKQYGGSLENLNWTQYGLVTAPLHIYPKEMK